MGRNKEKEDPVYSEYWLDDQFDPYIPTEESKNSPSLFSLDLIRLAAYRRIISNYVRILTRKSIPVQFINDSTGQDFGGKTTGKVVYITASIKEKKDLDWTVGLALHEGSHIELSDWEIVRELYNSIPFDLKEKAKKKNLTIEGIAGLCKHIFNVVEDRYVDSFVFSTAPGYRGYYKSMYYKLWNNELLGEVLKSKMYRLPNVASYLYRVTNLTNPDTDLNALPKLREISECIDIPNILRLNITKDRLYTSFKVVEMILDGIEIQVKEPDGIDKTIKKIQDVFDIIDGPDKGDKNQGDKNDGDKKENENGKDDNTDGESQISGSSGVVDGNENDPKKPEKSKEDKPKTKELKQDDQGDTSDFSPSQLKKIQKEIEKQEQAILRDYDDIKEPVSDKEKSVLDLIEKTGIVLVPVGMGIATPGEGTMSSVDCIVVHKMTKDLMLSGDEIFPIAKYDINKNPTEKYQTSVNEGFTLGRILGKRLQIRGEANPIKYIRKWAGKIERRLLAGIGAGEENIFQRTIIEKYNKARLHISVDISSSMESDEKWLPTIKCVVAICVASSMVENLKVSVSFRTTHQLDSKAWLPYVVLAYDSEVDKISKIRNLFPYLHPSGGTPEGLAFESILDEFIIGKQTTDQDHYFVNISDGEPCYEYSYEGEFDYQGEKATNHTKCQVEKIRAKGVKILSYFIKSQASWGGYNPIGNRQGQIPYTDTLRLQFQKMYGRDAKFIDVVNVIDISKTINQLFLTKE